MARYREAFRNRVVARLLPPESASVGSVAKEIGVSVQTLERWREEVQSRPGRGRAWTAGARLDAVITAAALDETGKSAWCREHGVYPAELDMWRLSATEAGRRLEVNERRVVTKKSFSARVRIARLGALSKRPANQAGQGSQQRPPQSEFTRSLFTGDGDK